MKKNAARQSGVKGRKSKMAVLNNFSVPTDIITDKSAKVKWTEKKEKNIEISRRLLKLSALAEDRAEILQRDGKDGDALTERMRAETYRKRGWRMKECSRFINISVCPDCGRSIASSATLCRDRVCPTCAWRLSAKQSAEMVQALAFINDIEDYDALFLTLTVRNCDETQLSPTLEMMSKAWNKMLARSKNRRLIKGTARSVEVTYNAKAKTFHPHYHIIMLVEKDERTVSELSSYFNKEWQTATNNTYQPITDLRRIENSTLLEYDKKDAEFYKKAILETFKYTIKDDSLADMPLSSFRYYVDGIQGKRLVAYTGIIKEARKQLDYNDELEDETEALKCPDCNADMLSAIYEWSFSEKTYKRFEEKIKKPS